MSENKLIGIFPGKVTTYDICTRKMGIELVDKSIRGDIYITNDSLKFGNINCSQHSNIIIFSFEKENDIYNASSYIVVPEGVDLTIYLNFIIHKEVMQKIDILNHYANNGIDLTDKEDRQIECKINICKNILKVLENIENYQ